MQSKFSKEEEVGKIFEQTVSTAPVFSHAAKQQMAKMIELLFGVERTSNAASILHNCLPRKGDSLRRSSMPNLLISMPFLRIRIFGLSRISTNRNGTN